MKRELNICFYAFRFGVFQLIRQAQKLTMLLWSQCSVASLSSQLV